MIRKLLCAVLLLAAQPALANGPIELPKEGSFRHERSGSTFPRKIAGFELTRLHDFSDDQYDVSAVYGGIDKGDEISVYLYRAAIPDVSLWTTMVVRAVQFRPQFRPADPATAVPRLFVPAGAKLASGVRMSFYTAADSPLASTAVALVPRGEWLLKVRVSSTTRTVTEIDGMIDEALAALAVPYDTKQAPAAYLVQPCPDRLEHTPAVPSTPEDEGFSAALFDSAMTSIVLPKGRLEELNVQLSEPVVWCEDEVFESGMRVYRPNARKDAYIIAISDAGTHLSVGQIDGPTKPQFKYPVVERTSQYDVVRGMFETLPTPDQAWQARESGVGMASTDRTSKVQINSNYYKGDAKPAGD